MPKTIDIEQLPDKLAALLDLRDNPVFLERHGKQVGVIVSPELYQQWQRRGDRLTAIMDEIGERNQDKSDDEVDRDIEEAIRQVRAMKK